MAAVRPSHRFSELLCSSSTRPISTVIGSNPDKDRNTSYPLSINKICLDCMAVVAYRSTP
jgi:hypothetical protein